MEPNKRVRPDDYGSFFETHGNWALQVGRSISGDEHSAGDISSFAFHQAYVGWDRFENRGEIPQERTWLRRVMQNYWLSEKRRDARLIEIDRPLRTKSGADAGMTLVEALPGEHVGDDKHSVRIYLLALIADALRLIRSNPVAFGLQEQEIDVFHREFELDDDEITAVDPDVKVAVARVRRVIRHLCLERMNHEVKEANRTLRDGEIQDAFDLQNSGNFRDAIDRQFDVVLDRMMEMKSTLFVSWKRMIVFKTYYAGDDRGTNLTGEDTYSICRRYGIAKGNIGGWLQMTRPPFCSTFEYDYSELVDQLEASHYYSPILDRMQRLATFTRREKLMLAGRGYPIPQQTFPPGHTFIPRRFSLRKERGA